MKHLTYRITLPFSLFSKTCSSSATLQHLFTEKTQFLIRKMFISNNPFSQQIPSNLLLENRRQVKNFLLKYFEGLSMILRFIILSIISITSLSAYTPETISQMPHIILIENFLTDIECDYIIEMARPQLKRSKVVDSKGDGKAIVHKARTSDGMFFSSQHSDKILSRIENQIAKLTEIPKENGEAFQVLRYKIGDEYKPHYDYFNLNTPGSSSHLKRGGQRLASVIIFLQDTPKGGATIFPKAGIEVQPIKGNAVIFYNQLPNGMEDPLTLHGGAPVLEGEKWIMVKWLRESEFH